MTKFRFSLKRQLVSIIACFILVFSGCFNNEAHIENNSNDTTTSFCYEELPAYDDEPFITVNGNKPFHSWNGDESTIVLKELDSLGRCQDVEAIVGKDTLPNEERGSIGDIRPSGWHMIRYDDLIESRYLYNRCHLIAFEISGINKDPRNLITGTRYLNIEGMFPFENQVASYIKSTWNHVYYHATPVFIDDELVCRGVLLEGKSIEDDQLEFCVFCYNVYPGILIDYSDGNSEAQSISRSLLPSVKQNYVVNTNTRRFHYPDCKSVDDMKMKNRMDVFENREALISQGYTPCGSCNP